MVLSSLRLTKTLHLKWLSFPARDVPRRAATW